MAGFDYLSAFSAETFPSGSNSNDTRCLSISILEDGALEANQTFTVTLATLDPNVILGNSVTTVTIVDNFGENKDNLCTRV